MKQMESEENSDIRNIELWRNFYRTWKTLRLGAGKNFSRIGISFIDYRIMRFLAENGQVPMARIADFLMVTQGHITGVIDVLESREFVKRLRSQNDRRVINVALTESGSEVEKKAKKIHEKYMIGVFGVLNNEEKAALNHSLEVLFTSLEES